MKPRLTVLFAGLIAVAALCGRATAASPAQSGISPDAAAAVTAMGKTLQAPAYSVLMRTIRVSDQGGNWIHVFHTSRLTVRRPDRLLDERTGDDGQSVAYAFRARTIGW